VGIDSESVNISMYTLSVYGSN